MKWKNKTQTKNFNVKYVIMSIIIYIRLLFKKLKKNIKIKNLKKKKKK